MPTIFITDLDGTLLGNDDFGFAVIRDDILSFLERGVAIIPNSVSYTHLTLPTILRV